MARTIAGETARQSSQKGRVTHRRGSFHTHGPEGMTDAKSSRAGQARAATGGSRCQPGASAGGQLQSQPSAASSRSSNAVSEGSPRIRSGSGGRPHDVFGGASGHPEQVDEARRGRRPAAVHTEHEDAVRHARSLARCALVRARPALSSARLAIEQVARAADPSGNRSSAIRGRCSGRRVARERGGGPSPANHPPARLESRRSGLSRSA